eukprot:GFUD01099665.1.p1 GENE.GFUD01099665.1~~GFUD01099665.1.p1  ORF type:complete len:345 (+),score=127.25 GFUD01099665.1:37-1071(+)
MLGHLLLRGIITAPTHRALSGLVCNSLLTARCVKGAHISTSAVVKCKDDFLKDDPDVKKLLSEINKDFDHKKKPAKPSEQPDDAENSNNDVKNNTNDDKNNTNVSGGKNVSQLLSELYGGEEEKKDKFSSVGGYKEYLDSDSNVIYDIDEEREIMRKAYLEGKPLQTDKKTKPSQAEKYKHLAHKRGERGVFEVSELVSLLKAEKISDLAVIKIPAERQYADYMVVGTARSTRHLRTVSSLLVSVFKQKRFESDPIPKREGESDTNTGWTALDMGNIVVHLLVQEQREYYDLEMLWAVGPEFDDNTRNMAVAEVNSQKIETLEDLMATEIEMEDMSREEFKDAV